MAASLRVAHPIHQKAPAGNTLLLLSVHIQDRGNFRAGQGIGPRALRLSQDIRKFQPKRCLKGLHAAADADHGDLHLADVPGFILRIQDEGYVFSVRVIRQVQRGAHRVDLWLFFLRFRLPSFRQDLHVIAAVPGQKLPFFQMCLPHLSLHLDLPVLDREIRWLRDRHFRGPGIPV